MTTGQIIPTPGVCAPGEGNAPIPASEYQRSLGVCLQSAVDESRRIIHEVGLRPYRVSMVWLGRDRKQRFTETVRKIELVPVKVSAFTAVSWDVSASGMVRDGDIVLSEVSPTQVDYNTLLGKIDDYDPDPGVNFFYEVEQIARCAGGNGFASGRYTPTSIPSFNGDRFEWTIALAAQQQYRAPEGTTPDRDQTFRPASQRRPRRSILRT
jgi:hypothetical protein